MPDKLIKIGHSLIQHGDENRRVYLMKLDKRDLNDIVPRIETLAEKQHYGKIFCKVPEWAKNQFEKCHYQMKAFIPGFYRGKRNVYFMSKFLNPDRSKLSGEMRTKITDNLRLAETKAEENSRITIQRSCSIRKLKETQMKTLARLYDRVYDSYPFPITNPGYLKRTMKSHIDYFGVFMNRRLIAAASGEKDMDAASAEMTDFATLPEHRGKGLATALLLRMEKEMREQHIITLYTIARALSPGMNITFARTGYHYTGTLINNTQIAGRIESMNVWYKHIA
ncbi:putative beta-lysine N-acetyltransferase [bacterium]|nr:putative beta-lysine N-acetyltransferase [bacterium]